MPAGYNIKWNEEDQKGGQDIDVKALNQPLLYLLGFFSSIYFIVLDQERGGLIAKSDVLNVYFSSYT